VNAGRNTLVERDVGGLTLRASSGDSPSRDDSRGPFWLKRMDEHFDEMRHLVSSLTRPPTEYFREHCFVTWEADETDELAQLIRMGLEGGVLWGSDYPHFDCVYPRALGEADKGLASLDQRVRKAVVHDNPARFAALDR
jgi:hypothetical protein